MLFSKDRVYMAVFIKIDEERKYVLPKVTNTKRGPKVKESDHNPIISVFNLSLKEDTKYERIEIFDLKG